MTWQISLDIAASALQRARRGHGPAPCCYYMDGLHILPELTVFVEAINLLNDQRIEHNTPLRRIANETYGSRYFLRVRARL